MQNQDPLPYKSSIFFHVWNRAQSHITYLQGLPEDFSGYCNKILANAQNFKDELQNMGNNGNNLMIEKECIGSLKYFFFYIDNNLNKIPMNRKVSKLHPRRKKASNA